MARTEYIDTTGPQFRVGYDATNRADFSVSATGDLTITPTGGNATINGRLLVTGSVGIGTTDIEAWDSARPAIEWTRSAIMGGSNIHVFQNAWFDGAAFRYKTAAAASSYYQDVGTHGFRVAAAGAAADDPISWITALTITSAGLKPLLPTSPTGLPSGTLWNDAGTVKVA